jgi:3-deoxy-D-manno-octulosonic-acid transferase
MYWLYSTLLALGLLVTLPYWLVQMGRHGKYRAGLAARLGRVPSHIKALGGQRVVWIHAVSVGEVLAVAGLIAEFRQALPEHRVLLSTTTLTGHTLAGKKLGEENVFYFPLDLGFAIQPYLRVLRPELVVLAETEFWPNFLRLAAKNGARVAAVNARISDRSLAGYRRFRWLIRRVLSKIDLFLAQTVQDRERLIEIGAAPGTVEISGNLKFDFHTGTSPQFVSSLRSVLEAGGPAPVLVCGSTLEGEEELLTAMLRAVLAEHPHAMMILAPRHPERFDEVAALLSRSGLQFWRRSQWKDEPMAGGVLLLDSIGELSAVYSLATLAFVGGSLVPRGGHNIIEPAQYGVPILTGPYTGNFRDIVTIFQRADAIIVVDASNLTATVLALLADEPARTALGARGLAALQAQAGATRRTMTALCALVRVPSVSPGGRAEVTASGKPR